jgi:hypothetical protein
MKGKSVKKPVSRMRPGPVLDAVKKVGGVRKAAALMDVSTETIYEWIDKGKIRKATAAVLLARASGAKAPRSCPQCAELERLIGM